MTLPPVGVADEDNGATDPADCYFCHRDVLGRCVLRPGTALQYTHNPPPEEGRSAY